jgi:hypothetical protein
LCSEKLIRVILVQCFCQKKVLTENYWRTFNNLGLAHTASVVCLKVLESTGPVFFIREMVTGMIDLHAEKFLHVGKEIINHAVQTTATAVAGVVGCHESRIGPT